jgi:MinD-like ATPase involved in chromosome partitioning or flagellar assembly
MVKILLITGKNSTGKTTLALNIASGLRKYGNRVLLIDTEANIPVLGYDPNFFINPYTLVDVVERGIDLEWALREFNGFKYLIGSWNSNNFKKISPDKILEIVDEVSTDFTHIIFDSSLSNEVVNLLSEKREVVFVTKPLIEEISDIGSFNSKKMGLLVNMVGKTKDEISPRAVEFLTQIPLLGDIPYDTKVLLALSVRKPVVEVFPDSFAAKKINEFVSRYVNGKIKFSRVSEETINLKDNSLNSIFKRINFLENKISILEKFLKEKSTPIVLE